MQLNLGAAANWVWWRKPLELQDSIDQAQKAEKNAAAMASNGSPQMSVMLGENDAGGNALSTPSYQVPTTSPSLSLPNNT